MVVAVARGGTYAWHDHRAHWMSRDSPPGFHRGDRIQDGEIPLVVNGGRSGALILVRDVTELRPAAPEPTITTLSDSNFFPTTFAALMSPASTTTAVPC